MIVFIVLGAHVAHLLVAGRIEENMFKKLMYCFLDFHRSVFLTHKFVSLSFSISFIIFSRLSCLGVECLLIFAIQI